jgi:hypothetical protein
LVERLRPIAPHDPRVKRRRRQELLDSVVLAVCGVLCGCESFVEIERFGKLKLDVFQRFLRRPHGIPSHETFSRVLALLRPQAFQECVLAWLRELRAQAAGDLVAVDGKTLRHTFERAAQKSARHSLSAWSSKHHLTLGPVAVVEKSNEITAIPKRWERLDL